MTNKKAIKLLAVKIPKGSKKFEKLYKLYGDYITGDRQLAIYVFNQKWSNTSFKALKKITKLYLKDLKPDDYKPSFGSFLDYELVKYLETKQKEF